MPKHSTAPSSPTASPGTRDRLVAAMADALQRRGLHGVGLSELLLAADAPKGVLYHHFPGGKAELAVAAIRAAVERLLHALDRAGAAGAHPADVLRDWLAAAGQRLTTSGFERGCPLATVALESGPEDTAIREALAHGFARIRERLATRFVEAGAAEARARSLAALVVSAYEGALMQARVAGDAAPLMDAAQALVAMLRTELDAARPAR